MTYYQVQLRDDWNCPAGCLVSKDKQVLVKYVSEGFFDYTFDPICTCRPKASALRSLEGKDYYWFTEKRMDKEFIWSGL